MHYERASLRNSTSRLGAGQRFIWSLIEARELYQRLTLQLLFASGNVLEDESPNYWKAQALKMAEVCLSEGNREMVW